MKTNGTETLSKLIAVCMKHTEKHHEKKMSTQPKSKRWVTMGRQSKATVNRARKAKCKEQKHNETKKEKKKRLKQQAKAKADCSERVPPAVCNELRQ
jgi:hypothetical protein